MCDDIFAPCKFCLDNYGEIVQAKYLAPQKDKNGIFYTAVCECCYGNEREWWDDHQPQAPTYLIIKMDKPGECLKYSPTAVPCMDCPGPGKLSCYKGVDE